MGSYMVGYPGETVDTLQETRALIEKHISIGGEYFYPTVFLFMPYPNTPVYLKLDEYKKRFGTKVLVDNLWKHSKTPYESITIQPSEKLDPDTLLRFYKEIYGWSKGECYSDEFASVFIINAYPKEGISTTEVEEAIYEEIKKLAAVPIDAKELEKIKNNIDADYIWGAYSNIGLAR